MDSAKNLHVNYSTGCNFNFYICEYFFTSILLLISQVSSAMCRLTSEPAVATPLSANSAVHMRSFILSCVGRIELLSQSNGTYAWQPRVVNAHYFKRIDWAQESVLLLIMSTAGDGEIVFFLLVYSQVYVRCNSIDNPFNGRLSRAVITGKKLLTPRVLQGSGSGKMQQDYRGSRKKSCGTIILCFQCFDAVGWAAGRASGL